MPRSGRMNVEAFAAQAAREIHGYKTDPWPLKGAQVLNLHYEIDNDTIDDLLPVTMRPSIPAWAVFHVTRYPDSPIGPFTIGEVRIGSRADPPAASSCAATSTTMPRYANWPKGGDIRPYPVRSTSVSFTIGWWPELQIVPARTCSIWR